LEKYVYYKNNKLQTTKDTLNVYSPARSQPILTTTITQLISTHSCQEPRWRSVYQQQILNCMQSKMRSEVQCLLWIGQVIRTFQPLLHWSVPLSRRNTCPPMQSNPSVCKHTWTCSAMVPRYGQISKQSLPLNVHAHNHAVKGIFRLSWNRNPFNTLQADTFRITVQNRTIQLRQPRLRNTNPACIQPKQAINERADNFILSHDSLNLQELDPTSSLQVLTDGSCTDLHNLKRSAWCGIFFTTNNFWDTNSHMFKSVEDIRQANTPRIEMYGEFTSHKDSFKAELMAVYQACKLLETHPQLNVNIVLDNLGVVKKANALLFGYKMTLHETLRTDIFLLWTAIQKLTTQRISQSGSLTFTWVKGHSTNQGNNHSDILASHHGANHNEFTNTFRLPTKAQTDMTYSPIISKKRVKTDLRKALSHYDSTIIAYRFLFST